MFKRDRPSAVREAQEPRYPGEARIPYAGRTLAGVYVNPDRALTNAVVWACHRYLTQTVAQLPVRVMRVSGGASRGGRAVSERVPNHPVEWVLGWRTNPELGPFQFKETMVGWALLWGNGYAEIERDNAGRVANLWPIHPERVTIKRDAQTRALIYEVRDDTGKVDLAPNEVFHLRGFGNDVVGLGVIEYAAQTIGWAQATDLFSAAFFGEGMHPRTAVKVKGKLTEDMIARMRAQWDKLFKGPRKSNRTVFLDDDAEIEKIPIQPNEAQFVETKQFQVEDICRWFGVPPHKVMHLLRSTNNNIEHQAIEVVGDAIAPWCVRIEEEATFKLFGQNRSGMYVKLDLKGLLRGDFKSRQEGLQIQRRNGIINGNDWCDLEDMPLIGAAGEKYIVEGNMTTLDKVGEAAPAAAAPPPAEPDPPQAQSVSPDALARMRDKAAEVLVHA